MKRVTRVRMRTHARAAAINRLGCPETGNFSNQLAETPRKARYGAAFREFGKGNF